jgi:hypothetical protein
VTEKLPDVHHEDLDPGIIQQSAIETGHELLIPINNLGNQFGNLDLGGGPNHLQHALQGES